VDRSWFATLLSMKTWAANARDAFKTQLWPIPTIAVIAALLLGLTLPVLESRINDNLPPTASSWLFGGDAAAARSLLDSISSSLITVTSLTFSLTVVTLQLASSQFSPRLLRTFTSDQFVQWTLALFLATFTFSLTVLRAVRSANGTGQSEFVPKFSVSLAFVLAISSVIGLVLFLAHLTAQIRVETMLKTVHEAASATMRDVLPERGTSTNYLVDSVPPDHALVLLATSDGFLTWMEGGRLVEIAQGVEARIYLTVYPGSFVVKGTPLGVAWSAVGGRLDDDAVESLCEQVAGCIHTGFERTAYQDVGYGLRQLTDVANKALSPGVNDPTTAVHALGHISAFLCDLADRDLDAQLLEGTDGQVCVTLDRPSLADYLELGISQPCRYGASDPQVLSKIFQVLLDLSYRVLPEQHDIIRQQLSRVRATAQAQDFDSVQMAGLVRLGGQVERNLRVH